MATCEKCDGQGKIDCNHCGGSGYEPSTEDMSLSGWVEAVAEAAHNVAFGPDECSECDGEGKIDCDECGGTGEIDE